MKLQKRNDASIQTEDNFYLLFEQEIQMWQKLVVFNVATQLMYNMKFTFITCNTWEMEKEMVKSLW